MSYLDRYQGYDKNYQTPYYELSIQRADVDLNLIKNININYTESGANNFSIELNDPDMKYIGSDIITEDALVVLKYGWKGNALATFSGYISVIDIDFPEDGVSALVIHVMDKTHIMNRYPMQRTWANKKISDVVASIYKEYGFKTVVTDTKNVLETISQDKITDIKFIENLLSQVSDTQVWITYVLGETAYFVPKDFKKKPSTEFNYKCNDFSLMQFSPRINKEQQQNELTDKELDLYTLKVNSIKTDSNTNKQLLGKSKVNNKNSRK